MILIGAGVSHLVGKEGKERAGGELQISHQLAFVLSKTFAIYHFRIEER